MALSDCDVTNNVTPTTRSPPATCVLVPWPCDTPWPETSFLCLNAPNNTLGLSLWRVFGVCRQSTLFG